MHKFSVSWHIIPLKFSNLNIICFGQKEPIKVQIFRLFEFSNENSPDFSCHLWNHKVRVYSNFASLLSAMKDNSSLLFISNLMYFEQKESSEEKFSDIWVVAWKLTKILSYFIGRKKKVGKKRRILLPNIFFSMKFYVNVIFLPTNIFTGIFFKN